MTSNPASEIKCGNDRCERCLGFHPSGVDCGSGSLDATVPAPDGLKEGDEVEFIRDTTGHFAGERATVSFLGDGIMLIGGWTAPHPSCYRRIAPHPDREAEPTGGVVTDAMVAAGAAVIHRSPCIDSPKLTPHAWMGLSRAVLEAALSVSPPVVQQDLGSSAEGADTQPGASLTVLVPKEPTEAMARAFREARPSTAVETEDGGWAAPAPDWFRAQYAAMIEAARHQPTEGHEAAVVALFKAHISGGGHVEINPAHVVAFTPRDCWPDEERVNLADGSSYRLSRDTADRLRAAMRLARHQPTTPGASEGGE